jgi:hypothetical protein
MMGQVAAIVATSGFTITSIMLGCNLVQTLMEKPLMANLDSQFLCPVMVIG